MTERVIDVVSAVRTGQIDKPAGIAILEIAFGLSRQEAKSVLFGTECALLTLSADKPAPPFKVATDPHTGKVYVNNDQRAFEKFVKHTGAKPMDADYVTEYRPEDK